MKELTGWRRQDWPRGLGGWAMLRWGVLTKIWEMRQS